MWNRRSTMVFYGCLLISAFMLIEMVAYTTHFLFGWQQATYNMFELCHSWLERNGLFIAGHLLNGVVMLTFIHLIWLVVKQLIGVHTAVNKLQKLGNHQLSLSMYERYDSTASSMLIVSRQEPLAMTIGFWRPRIVLSTGLLQLLDEEELEAVVQHERFHLSNRDPLRLMLLYVSASVFWYIPILRSGLEQYRLSREVLADQYAISRLESPLGLGSALLKLIKKKQDSNGQYSFVYASFAEHSINYRIEKIVNPSAAVPAWSLSWPDMLMSTAAFGSITTLFAARMML